MVCHFPPVTRRPCALRKHVIHSKYKKRKRHYLRLLLCFHAVSMRLIHTFRANDAQSYAGFFSSFFLFSFYIKQRRIFKQINLDFISTILIQCRQLKRFYTCFVTDTQSFHNQLYSEGN